MGNHDLQVKQHWMLCDENYSKIKNVGRHMGEISMFHMGEISMFS